ncbi:MAG: enoyl-CoA hydratase/isomerase family protein [Bacteroidetes bacterium]|nr:enoyl-CoA hydratase/isomerase family protein [Bacteroidota bacterium]
MKRTVRKAAILGSGVMGSRIAAHFANNGVDVLLLDIVPKSLSDDETKKGLTAESPAFRNRFAKSGLENAVKSNPAAFYRADLASRVKTGNFEDNFPEIKDADWILEAVIENLDIKKSVFEKVDQFRKPGSIVSTNTSGIPVHFMLEGRSEDFRKNFLGTHFFNPPRYLKLLEVIPTPETDRAVVDFILEYGDLFLGKSTVECKDTPDFIANRIGVFGMMNTFKVMEQLGLSVDEVDKLTGPVVGRPKSATFRTADIVGLDTLVLVASHLYEALPSDEKREVFKIPAYLTKMVENKWLGDKTKQGFFKKVKKEDGSSDILTLDLKTLEYQPKKKVSFPTLEMTKPVDDLNIRLKMIYMGMDKAAEFFKIMAEDLFSYASNRIPEISDDIYKIDKALRGGFGWDLGPFETWDVLGVKRVVENMEKNGRPAASWVKDMIAAGITSFYQRKDGKRYFYDIPSKSYCLVPDAEKYIFLDDLRTNKVIEKNAAASLFDLGDGVLGLEFHSKMNAIGPDTVGFVLKALDKMEAGWEGMVIGNQAPNFSAGANLALLLMAANEGDYDEIELMIRQFQKMTMRVRYSNRPVVVAPHGLTLGGGCELTLHADHVQAAAETYIGLVEVGVGLIPAGGGTKEMTLRAMDKVADGDVALPNLRDAFMIMGTGKVATSAHEAIPMGIIRPTDSISVNKDRQITDAKRQVLALAQEGYKQPQPRTDIRVLGKAGLATVKASIYLMWMAKQITDYDKVVAEKLAYIMCGGNLSEETRVSEQYLLDLEREAFVQLCGERRTLERIQHMLKTGKPLRN